MTVQISHEICPPNEDGVFYDIVIGLFCRNPWLHYNGPGKDRSLFGQLSVHFIKKKSAIIILLL